MQDQTFVVHNSLQIIDQRDRTIGIAATDIFNTKGVVHVVGKVLLPT